jgi:hypothetical protein
MNPDVFCMQCGAVRLNLPTEHSVCPNGCGKLRRCWTAEDLPEFYPAGTMSVVVAVGKKKSRLMTYHRGQFVAGVISCVMGRSPKDLAEHPHLADDEILGAIVYGEGHKQRKKVAVLRRIIEDGKSWTLVPGCA